jgi:hypothetical protein
VQHLILPTGWFTAQEDLNDAHAATATWAGMVGLCWLLGLGVGSLDGTWKDYRIEGPEGDTKS